MDYTISDEEKRTYLRDGCIIKRGIISPEKIKALRAGVRDLVECSANGTGPEIPWINREKRLPERIGLLLRPHWIRPAFVDSLVSGPYFPVSEQLLDAPARYSLFGMLSGGDGKPYVQGWHRDLAPIEGEKQLPVLERGFRQLVQTNAPLFSDRYLTIVPGSHLRPTTPDERAAHAANPTGEMPGEMTVEMEPGDVAFYNPNLWHRGYNPDGALRWTMHHAFMRKDAPVYAHEANQQQWMHEESYLSALPESLRIRMRRYLEAVPDGPAPGMAEM